MIKTFPIYWILIALVLPGAVARAAEENSARAGIGPVEPFIDGQTILVARLDTTRINFDSIEQWLGQAGQAQALVSQVGAGYPRHSGSAAERRRPEARNHGWHAPGMEPGRNRSLRYHV